MEDYSFPFILYLCTRVCVLAHVLGMVLCTHGLACMCDCVETRNLYQVPSTFFIYRFPVNKAGMTCLSLPPQQCVCTEPSFYALHKTWAPNSGTHAALPHLPYPPSLLKVWLLTSGRHHISVLFLMAWLLPPKLVAGSFIRPTLHMRAHGYDQNRSPALLLYLFSPSDLIQVSYINTPIHIFYSDLASDVRY